MAGDAFAPLGSTPDAGPARDEWRAVLPAPHPLPASFRHPRHGTPGATWPYHDASGALLFVVARFDTAEGKEVMPYSCNADGWRWKGPPAPRPLYGLDRLAARAAAPVLLVEGEKAADAAARLFPEHVAITWPGGSAATGRTIWTPLKARRVTVWPDNDDAGRKAATEAARALRTAGAASVAVVEVPREWPAGWDLADPLPDGVTPEEIAALVADAAPARPAADAGSCAMPRPFVMRPDGVWWMPAQDEDTRHRPSPVRPAARDLLAGWRAARAAWPVPTVPTEGASTGHAEKPRATDNVPTVPTVPTSTVPAPKAPPPPPFLWPADVDFHVTRAAARLSGEVAAGASWRWCSSGALDVELVSGRMWLLSPSTAGRLREAGLLPEMVATMRARP